MDANIKAAQNRLSALRAEKQAITKRMERMERDAANLAIIEAQITALEPLATAPAEQPAA